MKGNEIWKDIIGYEGRYKVSNIGQIKSISHSIVRTKGSCISKEKIIKPSLDVYGYNQVVLYKGFKKTAKRFLVHRLVAFAFIENPDNLQTINHINEIRNDNRVDNLEWCSLSDNIRYSKNIPVLQLDLNNNIIKKWDSIRDTMKYGFTPTAVCRCCKGKSNTHKNFKWQYYV